MGMIMHDDVPYGEGTSYTQGTGIAINNNIIAVDADNAPTENSEKPVKSKGVYSALESSREESTSLLKSTVGWTGKNLLPNKATSQTVNGITFTVNADGSITVNGTASAQILFYVGKIYIADNLIFSGCAPTGSSETYDLRLSTFIDYGEGVKVNLPYDESSYGIYIVIRNGYTANNLTFYPMLRDASITDDTYEPYHESVEEEIEQIYADNGVLGAKNLLPNNATSQNINGITFTVNDDLSVTLNGTATANTDLFIYGTWLSRNNNIYKKGIPYRVSMKSSKNAGYHAYVQTFVNGSAGTTYVNSGTEGNFTIASDSEDGIRVMLVIENGATFNNDVIYPMIRLASDPDDTYVPYAMTNRELTEEKLSISELKTIASSAADFAAFKTAIANL